MIKSYGWNDLTFDQAIHMEACFLFLKHNTYVNDRMTYGELEVLVYVRVEAHDVNILNSFFPVPCNVDEWPRLGPCTGHHGYTTASVALWHARTVRTFLQYQTHIPIRI